MISLLFSPAFKSICSKIEKPSKNCLINLDLTEFFMASEQTQVKNEKCHPVALLNANLL